MGCVSSKLAKSDLERERFAAAADHVDPPNHIVSLTSTTYGVLNLDREQNPVSLDGLRKSVSSPISYKRVLDETEVINTWELMHDLHDEVPCHPSPQKIDKFIDPKSSSNQKKSAKKQRKKSWSWGKENKENVGGGEAGVEDEWGRAVLQPFTSIENLQAASPSPLLKARSKRSLNAAAKLSCLSTKSTRSLSPFFDPELVESFEKELSIEKEQKEQIKMIISPISRTKKLKDSDPLLSAYEKICPCPPGGENAVVIYTTTLRGIRKTFEDCNRVRSLIEAYDVQFIERDTSMDSGFREELKALMGEKGGVRVPMVFVKGRLIGGADEMIKLEEGGKLSSLFQGMPAAQAWCVGCGGLRFVMCMDCNGSCKVLDENGKKTARCGECNENGLIQCPICC